MSLSSAKAKLDAQGGDPATGYISKQDHKDSYDQLVADTALTGATTAEAVAVSGTTDASSATTGTLKTAGGLGVAKKAYVGTDLAVGGALTVGTTVNGRDPDDLAKGAASSTDNALVRFDGTDGKTVQNSGITVDDSNNVTGLGTVASGAVTSSAAVQAAAGSGFVVGSSGPKIMSGTGSPESVVTAPVGSTWTDTAATTGAIQWIKATGTGNTGWKVQYGDTGWRECVTTDTAIFTNATFNAANPNAFMHIRRLGGVVFMRFYSGAGTFTTNYQTIITMPAGFRPTAYTTPAGVTAPSIQMFSAVTLPTLLGLYFQNASELRNGQGWGSGAAYHGATSWTGDDSAWPTSLPGIALT